MITERLTSEQRATLQRLFGDRLQPDIPLAPFTSARIGGIADYLVEIGDAEHLRDASRALWDADIPFRILGGGSNVLISDEGVREVILLNKARQKRFVEDEEGLFVWAESGSILGTLARLAAERGWGGLEWAATIPGTLGGAVVGNAGAHGSDMTQSLSMAEILQHDGQVLRWSVEDLDYSYRSSKLKQHPGRYIVLAATLKAETSSPAVCKQRMREFSEHRAKTQPTGASMGSMFKNPPDDYAGRLIEQAGLKGMVEGAAQISMQHANFFINLGGANAEDVWQLIEKAREKVYREFEVQLELEVELLGAWKTNGIVSAEE